jgi:hypothetical protein
MNEHDKKLYLDLDEAFRSIGMNMLSDDLCCKLLAYTYVMGGGNEAVVYNVKMNTDIKIAQDRLNLHGGEVPNQELLPLLQQRIKELEKDMEKCEWLDQIIIRYFVSFSLKSSVTSKQPKPNIQQSLF